MTLEHVDIDVHSVEHRVRWGFQIVGLLDLADFPQLHTVKAPIVAMLDMRPPMPNDEPISAHEGEEEDFEDLAWKIPKSLRCIFVRDEMHWIDIGPYHEDSEYEWQPFLVSRCMKRYVEHENSKNLKELDIKSEYTCGKNPSLPPI